MHITIHFYQFSLQPYLSEAVSRLKEDGMVARQYGTDLRLFTSDQKQLEQAYVALIRELDKAGYDIDTLDGEISRHEALYVNVYLCHSTFDDTEEGGWYEATEEILESHRCLTPDEADALRKKLLLEYPNEREYDIYIEDEKGTNKSESGPGY